MVDIVLGFPEERESAWLTNRYFPNKVGGKPAWLELENLPCSEELLCGNCKEPKSFLCQIYAPYEDEHNFHRTIYVFVCRSIDCQISNSAKYLSVYRSQLPKKNAFYSEKPPIEEGTPLPEILPTRKLCAACGCVGQSSCSRCRKVSYCSVKHQRADWPHHKQQCMTGTQNTSVVLPDIMFPEWEIVIEPTDAEEDSTIDEDDEEREKLRLEEYKILEDSGKTGTLNDLPESELDQFVSESAVAEDKFFRRFKKKVDKDPEQIVRYKRGGNPLWIADVDQTVVQQLQIPCCGLCGSERNFEFQIMPQMLNLLKDDHLDWGTLAIYTCSKSCVLPLGIGYAREYILKQDIISN